MTLEAGCEIGMKCPLLSVTVKIADARVRDDSVSSIVTSTQPKSGPCLHSSSHDLRAGPHTKMSGW